jgi:Leucine-rich repeat (LRR) protein
MAKLSFDNLYDSLVDSFGLFGDERKFYDFYFLHFEYNDYNDILNFLFNENEENKYLLTNSLDKLEAHKVNRKSFDFIIICKAINFENLITKCEDRISDTTTLEEILKTKIPENKGIFQLSDYSKEKSFYFFTNKNLVIPEYVVEYSFIQNDKPSVDSVTEMSISAFTNKVDLQGNFYECFNEASRIIYSKDFTKRHYHDSIKKYYPCKIFNMNELMNTTFFFIKASLVQFINFCFPYNDIDVFNHKLIEISDKLEEIDSINNEITHFDDSLSKLCLFGCKIQTVDFFATLSNFVELSLSNCRLESFDFSMLPAGMRRLDISHNFISEIKHNQHGGLKDLDISFNHIRLTEDICELIISNKELENLNFLCNPLKVTAKLENLEMIANYLTTQKSKLEDTPIILSPESNLKQIDLIYDTYSFDKKFSKFSTNSIFLQSDNLSEHNDSTVLILSKKKLKTIPTLITENIQILYLNINKITQIEHLESLASLQELHIQDNKLVSVNNLNNLTNLKKLDFSNNMLQTIEGISNLKQLEWLNVENNVLHSIFITELLTLSNLIEFHASGNYITNLKECLQLKNLENLNTLDLSGNDVSRVSDFKQYMIFYLTNLKILNRNTIDKTDVVSAKEYFDGRLTNEILESKIGNQPTTDLLELTLSSCKLKDFEGIFDVVNYPKLTKLDLSRNMFTSFKIFGYLPNLKTLYLSSNLFDKILNKKDKLIQNKGIQGLPVFHF